MYIFGLPKVVYPVGLFGIDIGSEGLHNRLDGAFCAAICLLVKCSRWHEVNVKSFIEFSKEIGDKLRSSIRDDFARHPTGMAVADLTYECINDISGWVFLFLRH